MRQYAYAVSVQQRFEGYWSWADLLFALIRCATISRLSKVIC